MFGLNVSMHRGICYAIDHYDSDGSHFANFPVKMDIRFFGILETFVYVADNLIIFFHLLQNRSFDCNTNPRIFILFFAVSSYFRKSSRNLLHIILSDIVGHSFFNDCRYWPYRFRETCTLSSFCILRLYHRPYKSNI